MNVNLLEFFIRSFQIVRMFNFLTIIRHQPDGWDQFHIIWDRENLKIRVEYYPNDDSGGELKAKFEFKVENDYSCKPTGFIDQSEFVGKLLDFGKQCEEDFGSHDWEWDPVCKSDLRVWANTLAIASALQDESWPVKIPEEEN